MKILFSAAPIDIFCKPPFWNVFEGTLEKKKKKKEM